MTPLAATVIGFGVGEQHARLLDADPRARLVSVCDFDPQKRAAAAALFPSARIHETANAAIEDPDVELVVVASYDSHHFAQIAAALRAGKHVFAEKPMCTRPEDTRAVRALLREAPTLRLSTNTVLRASPRFQALRAAIRAGEFGRIYCVEADYAYGRLHKLTEGWRGDEPDYSVMLGGGVHMVDMALWLTGERVVSVQALGSNMISAGSKFDGLDTVLALLQFENGAIGKVGANFACVEPHTHKLTIYGENATYVNGAPTGRLWRSRDPEVAPALDETPYPGVAKHALLDDFLNAVQTGSDPIAPEDDVFATLAVCHAIDTALATGQATMVERL